MALRVTGILDLDGSRFGAGLRHAESAAGRFAATVGTRLAAVFSVAAMTQWVRRSAEWAGNMADLSAKTGIAVEELQRMEASAKSAGVSLDDMIRGFQMLESIRFQAVRSGDKDKLAAFGGFGISPDQLKNSSTQALFKQIASSVASTQNVESLIGPIREVFGKSGPELIEAFSTYAGESMQNLAVMSAGTANELDALGDSLAILEQELMAGIAPVLVKVIDLWRQLQNYLAAGASALAVLIQGIRNGWKDSPKDIFASAFNDALADFESKRNAGVPGRKRGFRSIDEFMPAEFNAPVQSRSKASIYTDQLLAVGNFLGQAGTAVNSVQNKMLQEMKKTNRVLEQIRDKLTSGDDLGI